MVSRYEFQLHPSDFALIARSKVVAAFFMAAGCLVLAVVPPFSVFVFALALLGFGGGLYDAALTTVISHEEDGVLMSCMYACFGVSESSKYASALSPVD